MHLLYGGRPFVDLCVWKLIADLDICDQVRSLIMSGSLNFAECDHRAISCHTLRSKLQACLYFSKQYRLKLVFLCD